MTLLTPVFPDQQDRDAAIAARGVNVLVDAGAGTGKTSLLVARLVSMVAPSDGQAPVPLARIAAITFTRKAAGELRLRVREKLLKELGQTPDPARERLLADALGSIDTAWIGTIHSFADRLLRLRPREAELSPSYEIVEDDDPLIHETFHRLLHAAQAGTLHEEAGHPLAREASETVRDALRAGILAESREFDFADHAGLDALVEGFIRFRDVDVPTPDAAPFDADELRRVASAIAEATAALTGDNDAEHWMRGLSSLLQEHLQDPDPRRVLAAVRRHRDGEPKGVTRKHTFNGDDGPWQAWKAVSSALDALTAPLDRWLATRLVRTRGVVLALYERVKERHRAVDQTDLLLKLRDLLKADRDTRADFQAMFDHLFVDEFQDTDPLQAEIVLFLCENGARADRWEDVTLRPGSLTLVGDPKQSIYRFRRADIKMYDQVCALVKGSDCLNVTLSTNFRSHPALIEWFNDRFQRVLGTSPDGARFNGDTGSAYHQSLAAGRSEPHGPCVHVLQFPAGASASDTRAAEGQALARLLRGLVQAGRASILDPETGQRRPVRYEDVAVLAMSTRELPHLFRALDEADVPYASRGGRLFLQDPLHRQFLLGLRALADRDDGVAQAALLRPPFFAVDPGDMLCERAGEAPPGLQEAREFIRDLRRRRFDRPPGATARDLLERTAFARVTAVGPNGAQRVSRLREICLVLEELAAADGLDYDGATAVMRGWVDDAIAVDPPHPIGSDAVKILTVHQAKGLEFPVVVHWDSLALWKTRADGGPWQVSRDGAAWRIALHRFQCQEPADADLAGTEKRFLEAERRRLVYVSATRARDMLILPDCGGLKPQHICYDLLHDSDVPALTHGDLAPAGRAAVEDATALYQDIDARWRVSLEAASRPRFSPASVSGVSHEEDVLSAPRRREGRLGPVFGTTVHTAIARVLERRESVETAVSRSCRLTGLDRNLVDAERDVQNAIDALRAAGLMDVPCRLEYPVAGVEEGRLLGGYVDLLAAGADTIDVIDFKTDPPPKGSAEAAYPAYAVQARTYGRLVREALGRPTRAALLFTADGTLHWLP